MPDHCKKSDCAILLTTNYTESTFVLEHINSKFLYIQVVLMDELNLIDLVQSYDKFDKAFLVLASFPSLVMPSLRHYNSLGMEYYGDGWDIYQEKPLRKYMMYSDESTFYDFINSLVLNNSMALTLLDEVLKSNETYLNDRYDQVACKNIDKTVSIISEDSKKIAIKIGALFPNKLPQGLYDGMLFTVLHNNGLHRFVFSGLENAAQRAISDINNSSMLGNLKLELEVKYSNCDLALVINDFIKLSYIPNLLGVIGPACSHTLHVLSPISSHIQLPIVSYSADGGSLSDRSLNPYMFRSIGDSQE